MFIYTQIKFGIKFSTFKSLLKIFIVPLIVYSYINNTYACQSLGYSNLSSLHRINNKETCLPAVTLKKGNAFIKGKVYGLNPVLNNRIRIGYHNPIMNKPEVFIVDISRNGDFFMDVPILSNATCLFISDYYKEYILLSPGDTCFLYIDAKKIEKTDKFNAVKRGDIDNQYVRFGGAFAEVNNDLNHLHFWSSSINLFNYKNNNLTNASYKTYILSTLEKSLNELQNKNISKQTKELITINLRQLAIRCLLDDRNLLKHHLDKEDLSTPAVNIDYFSFLEEMNINSLYSFYGRFFSNIIDQCRQIQEMIKPLGDLINERHMPQKALVLDDVKKQKVYLAQVLKENEGPAFELLEVLNFTSKIKRSLPLEEWEINRLKQLSEPIYYNCVTKNNELLSFSLDKLKKKSASVIFDVSKGKKDNYFENILSSYEGNSIMVNYWSIGCLGALNAMKIIEPLKIKYKNKKVVFIHLTDDIFLYQSWRNKAVQIEGIHYRLNKKQIDYILSEYKMKDITPSFLVFDKKGECIFKQKGYSKNTIKDIFDAIDGSI